MSQNPTDVQPLMLVPADSDGGSGTRWWIAVGLLTILGLALRLFAIDKDSIWYDEAFTALQNEKAIADLALGRVYDPGNPPLYYMVSVLWSRSAGSSSFALRMLPTLFGVLSIPIYCSLGKRLLGQRTSLSAGLLFSISPMAVELSNEARAYSLAALLSVLCTWLFVEWVARRSIALLVAYGVLVFLVMYTHYYGVLVPFAHALALAALTWSGRGEAASTIRGGDWEPRRYSGAGVWIPWFGAMGIAALLGASWLPTFLTQLRSPGNLARMEDRWPLQFLATPMVFALGRNLAWRDDSLGKLAACSIAALIGWWLPALLALCHWRRPGFREVLLGALAISPILLPLILALTFSPIYATRYAFLGVPAFLLLTAWGLDKLPSSLRRLFWVLILTLSAASLYCYGAYPLKDDWRSEARYVLDRLQPGETVVFQPGYEILGFNYYAQRDGRPLPDFFAVRDAFEDSDKLQGVRYRGGVKVEQQLRDLTSEILAYKGLYLVTCHAQWGDRTVDFLTRRGFVEQADGHRFKRMQIRRFLRE